MKKYHLLLDMFLTISDFIIFCSSSGIENCATVGYEAIDYFSSGFNHVGNKSQLDKNMASSKRQGNVQNKNAGQKSNIISSGGNGFSIFESGNLGGDGMMDLGQVVERPPPKR